MFFHGGCTRDGPVYLPSYIFLFRQDWPQAVR